MVETLSGRARELFAPLGPTYDRYARLLSFGQDPLWRRFLVSRLPVGPDDLELLLENREPGDTFIRDVVAKALTVPS